MINEQIDHNKELINVSGLEVHFTARTGFLTSLINKQISLVRAVDGLDFSIGRGEILCLAGESGSGKTTTGKASLTAPACANFARKRKLFFRIPTNH